MKNLMKEAHKMTKEIKEKYPKVDYKTQLGLCLSYLSSKEKEEEEMVELKGSEKQIKWAEDIRRRFLEICDKHELKILRERYINCNESWMWINNRNCILNNEEELIMAEMFSIKEAVGGEENLFFNEKYLAEKKEWERLDEILDEIF